MNPKIVKKLLSCYPELKSELSSTRRELRDVEHKKSDLAHPKAVSWDGAHSQNPVAQADILTGLISDEIDAAQRAAALETCPRIRGGDPTSRAGHGRACSLSPHPRG